MDDEKNKEIATVVNAAIVEEKSKAVLAVVEAVLAEGGRRARGEFDGLLGSLPEGGPFLLSDILDELRGVLLEQYSENEARKLLNKYRLNKCRTEKNLHGPVRIPNVPNDVELALRLLTLIASATACEGERFAKIVLGSDAARDAIIQVGRAEGGIVSGLKRAKDADLRHQEWIRKATSMIAAGTSIQNVASKVAKSIGVTPATVRPVLQLAGLLPPKKTKVK